MANWLQRFIYHISNAAPFMILTSIVWYCQKKTYIVPVILKIIAASLIFLLYKFFNYSTKNGTPKAIVVKSIASQDSWVSAYFVSYLLPLATLAIPNFNLIILIVSIAFLVLIIATSIMALPNILLFFGGYHFYEINAEDSTGIKDYLMISKRKRLRDKTDVKTVMRIFEKLLLDIKEDS